jgi:hypothetical protein
MIGVTGLSPIEVIGLWAGVAAVCITALTLTWKGGAVLQRVMDRLEALQAKAEKHDEVEQDHEDRIRHLEGGWVGVPRRWRR